jgi:hypothetical protein
MPKLDYVLKGHDACRCGRSAEKRHCPKCGSYEVYGLASRSSSHMNRETGEAHEYKVFRCKKCGDYSDDWELFYHCEAPKFENRRTALEPKKKYLEEKLKLKSKLNAEEEREFKLTHNNMGSEEFLSLVRLVTRTDVKPYSVQNEFTENLPSDETNQGDENIPVLGENDVLPVVSEKTNGNGNKQNKEKKEEQKEPPQNKVQQFASKFRRIQ